MLNSRTLYPRLLAAALTGAALCGVGPALAQFAFQAPAGAGQTPLTVYTTSGQLAVSTCTGVGCAAAQSVAVPAPPEVAGGLQAQHVELLDLGEERRAVLVRYPLADGAVFEGLFAGALVASGAPLILHATTTQLSADAEGELRGEALDVVDDPEHSRKIVYRGQVRPQFSLCGRPTLLAPRALLARDLAFHGVKLQRLTGAERAAASVLKVSPVSALSAENALTVVGASSAEGNPQSLVDGDASTAWAEGRGGTGRGEFVVFRTPGEVPIHAFELTVPAQAAVEGRVLPRQVYVATEGTLFAAELPPTAGEASTTYRFDLPAATAASCVALVLDTAQEYLPAASTAAQATAEAAPTRGNGGPSAPPAAAPEPLGAVDVSVAEFSAQVSVTDEAVLAAVADLDADSDAAERAHSLLQVAGKRGVRALAAALPRLSPPGRARALSVLESLDCGDGAPGWSAALGTNEGADDADIRGRLEGCPRSTLVARALAKQLKRAERERLGVLAETLAVVDAPRAMRVLLRRLGKPSRGQRKFLRRGLRVAVANEAMNPAIEAYLRDDQPALSLSQIELLGALGARITTFQESARLRITQLLAGAPSFETRYRLLGPLAELGRVDGGTAQALAQLLGADPAPAVRARAAQVVWADNTPVLDALLRAVRDPAVRVRFAAVERLGEQRVQSAAGVLAERVLEDRWPLVRAAGVRALGQLGGVRAAETLAEAVREDESADVRRPALVLLGNLGATDYQEVIAERLEDGDEDPYVRAAAAGALAQLCARSAVEPLTRFTKPLRALGGSEGQAILGRAAIAALGRLAPADLKERLAPLRSKQTPAWVQQVAEAALHHPNPCGGAKP